jgi:pimeloyl-ACP methyl ester carboxylesterase
MQSRFVDLDGPVHYADFGGSPGTGPPLVLVHGLGGSHLNWMAAAPLLARRSWVLAPDLIGFGRTPLAGRQARVRANQRLLGRFLERVVGAPAVLVGNSMGGLISILEAAEHPQRVAALVLVDPAVPRPRGVRLDREVRLGFTLFAIPGLGERFLAHRRTRLGAERLVADVLRLCCVDAGRVNPEVVAAMCVLTEERNRHKAGDQAFLAATRSLLLALARPGPYLRAVRAVTAPTLLLQGDGDRLVPLRSVQALARAMPTWTLQVLDGMGHVPHLEDPERFAAVVTAWLDAQGRSLSPAGPGTRPSR